LEDIDSLRHIGDLLVERLKRIGTDREIIDLQASGTWFIKTHQQIDETALSGTAIAYKRIDSPFARLERHASERLLFVIPERDIKELYALDLKKHLLSGDYFGALDEKFIESFGCGYGILELVVDI
jgi:hypothetical protein